MTDPIPDVVQTSDADDRFERLRRSSVFRLGAIVVCGLGLAGAATTLVRVSQLALDGRLEGRREGLAAPSLASRQSARPIEPARPAAPAPKAGGDVPPPAITRDKAQPTIAALPPPAAMPVPAEASATAVVPPTSPAPVPGPAVEPPAAPAATEPGSTGAVAVPSDPPLQAATVPAPAPAPAVDGSSEASPDRTAAAPATTPPATRTTTRRRVRATFFDPRALKGAADPAPAIAPKPKRRALAAAGSEPPPAGFRRIAPPAGSGPNVRAYSLAADGGRVDATGTRVLTVRVR